MIEKRAVPRHPPPQFARVGVPIAATIAAANGPPSTSVAITGAALDRNYGALWEALRAARCRSGSGRSRR